MILSTPKMQIVSHVGPYWWAQAVAKCGRDILLTLGIWFETTWLQHHQMNCRFCIAGCPKNLHRSHHRQDFCNTKPICVCTLDALAYFGGWNCNHYQSKDHRNMYLVIWAVLMSAVIAHTNQVHEQMCAVGGGEFVDVFEPTSLFRLSWAHPGSGVCAQLVKQRALRYPLLARAGLWVKLGCIIPALWSPRPSTESWGDILSMLENHQSIS